MKGNYSTNGYQKAYLNALKILTPREIEVLEKVSKGYTSKEIGDQLFISKKTVQKHRQMMCKKLGVQGYRGLFHWCRKFYPSA